VNLRNSVPLYPAAKPTHFGEYVCCSDQVRILATPSLQEECRKYIAIGSKLLDQELDASAQVTGTATEQSSVRACLEAPVKFRKVVSA